VIIEDTATLEMFCSCTSVCCLLLQSQPFISLQVYQQFHLSKTVDESASVGPVTPVAAIRMRLCPLSGLLPANDSGFCAGVDKNKNKDGP
jgi:hypothetical protein